jgi:nicotinamidase-related amidase
MRWTVVRVATTQLAKRHALRVDIVQGYTTIGVVEEHNMAMTMLQMAGATPSPATMADGILLIIDAQREYTDGLMPLTGVQPAIEALAGLLEKARKAGAPIVHVRHQSKGKAFNPASSGYEIVAPLAPRPGETIVDKGLPNAFAGTDLAEQLAACGRKNLIVGGFMTHMCVSATVRSATDNGYMSTIAADTVATRDLPDATGGPTISADAINRITLAALSDRFAWIVPKASQIG